jgi:hypothetical protein
MDIIMKTTNMRIIIPLVLLCFVAILALCYIENYGAIGAGGLEHIVDTIPNTVIIPIIMLFLIGGWRHGSNFHMWRYNSPSDNKEKK